MRCTTKPKSISEGWGMGFLFVFFAEDEAAMMDKKKTDLLSSSSSLNPLLRRSNANHLLFRAQSTISICALLVFTTLLLFTLSTFEPPTTSSRFTSRRQLSSKPQTYKANKHSLQPPSWSVSLFSGNLNHRPDTASLSGSSHALQGMGTLYRRGTKAMNNLIVAHVLESVEAHELRLFLRVLHYSALASRSDLVFLFPSISLSSEANAVILEENESFLNLINRYQEKSINCTDSAGMTQFVRLGGEGTERGEPIWGRRIRSNYSEDDGGESTQLSYGSVVGFEVDELEPENSLAGFLDHIPMGLRRWACYPMLLGRVRRSFRHTMLVDVKEMLVLSDPFARVRNQSPESVYLSTVSDGGARSSTKHGRKNSVKTQSLSQKPVNPGILVGGTRGVRRLSSAMLTEIARVAMQNKRKNSLSESGLFNQLVGSGLILNNVNLIVATESIPDASSLAGLKWNSGSSFSLSNYTVISRGNSNTDLTSTIMKQICGAELYSSVYSDC